MRLTMTGAWLILSAMALLLIFAAILNYMLHRRTARRLVLTLHEMRYSHGPVTTDELALRVGVRPHLVEPVLEDLFGDGLIVGFTDSKQVRHWHITSICYARLERCYLKLRV